MKDRRTFLTVVGMTGAALVLPRSGEAQTASPEPAGSRATSPAHANKPTPAAMAAAATFRRFDAGLSDADIVTITRGIDENSRAARSLNPHGTRLHNGDEPVTVFTVRG